jgi:imidazoleglycerol phosphate dehydratase HisB
MTSDAFVVKDLTVQELTKSESKKSGSVSMGVGFFNHMVSRIQVM